MSSPPASKVTTFKPSLRFIVMAATDRSWLAVPPPIRHLFDLFPLATLPAEALPARAPARSRIRPQLYVFTRNDAPDTPSFNPSCLKWQTFLRIAGVQVDLVPSNNHASPSGALPFLLPPSYSTSSSTSSSTLTSTSTSTSSSSSTPLTGGQIARYARDHARRSRPTTPSRYEPYAALLSQAIRPAWLYTLYLLPPNLPLLSSLYLPPAPLSLPTLRSLRAAATTEILKSTRRPAIAPDQLLAEAKRAFDALSVLLGDDEWFFGTEGPGIMDADVFAYTWLILDDALGWGEDSLRQCVAGFDNLVRHKDRLYERCWPE